MKIFKEWIKKCAENDLRNPYQFVVVVLLAAVLLFQHAWVPGFFHDGHLYAALGKNILLKGMWIIPSLSETHFKFYHYHPPLYAILEGMVFWIFGYTWVVARIFSCLWGWGAVLLLSFFIYGIGRGRAEQEGKSPSFYIAWAYLSGIFLALFPPLYKKARSPHLDVALTFLVLFALYFYFRAFEYFTSGKNRRGEIWCWLAAGVFFGLALLMKGPPALIIPMVIAAHLLCLGYWKKLFLDFMPWVGLLLGGAVFALWPLFAWKWGILDHFFYYLSTQVKATVIEGRGRQEYLLGTYPYYLLENVGPWFLLAFWGIYALFRDGIKKNPLGLLFLLLYLLVVVPFSFVRWKYSNYIVPCFPALAALAAYPFAKMSCTFHGYFTFWVKRALVVVVMVLLIFPVTVRSGRDVELFRLLELMKYYDSSSEEISWVIVNEVYPFHNVVNLMAWQGKGNVMTDLTKSADVCTLALALRGSSDGRKWGVFISSKDYEEVKQACKGDGAVLEEELKKFIYFPTKDFYVLFSKSVFKKEFMVDYGN
ncbi:MAG: glycosyltransferase family 39 protein [Oligoflexia bacterium]|nr:glycosyltransferase family 39 protein [Oligoflexia bacterium]MBF0366733.1 glycosyltransferase family 39 protein [Oligoflexia bacterium]